MKPRDRTALDKLMYEKMTSDQELASRLTERTGRHISPAAVRKWRYGKCTPRPKALRALVDETGLPKESFVVIAP